MLISVVLSHDFDDKLVFVWLLNSCHGSGTHIESDLFGKDLIFFLFLGGGAVEFDAGHYLVLSHLSATVAALKRHLLPI